MRPPRRLPVPDAMIVAPQPEAVEAGADMLRRGGSAMDAVLACAFVQGVVDPMMCGPGGLGVLTLFDPADGRVHVWDGLSTCPAASREDQWADLFIGDCRDGYGYELRGAVNELGHGAVTTPGILQLLASVHGTYGARPWRELPAAAAAIARRGYLVRPHVAAMFALDEAAVGRLAFRDKLAFSPDGAALYLRADGTPKRAGDTVRNPNLAAALELVAEDADTLSTGALATEIAAEMARGGGALAAADLAGYDLRRREPLLVPYRGYTIATPPAPAGGIVVAEMLRILERFDLVAMGHNSAEYIRILAEAMRIAGADKERHVGDPDWQPTPPHLLSDAYAADRAAAIVRGERASLSRVPEPAGTTTVSCVDARGLVVSLTHTLGLPSGVMVPGRGFMLNGAMNWYDPRPGRPGSIAPGKRRFSSMAPTVVLRDGVPVATLGAPGGAWIGVAILQVLLNLLDWGMGAQEAVMAPRVSATGDMIDLSNRIPFATETALNTMGYATVRSPMSYAFAAVHAITLWDGVPEGGADPQRDGYAAAVA